MPDPRLRRNAEVSGRAGESTASEGPVRIRAVPSLRDPDGHEITVAAWLALFSDRASRWTLSTFVGHGRRIVTTWFGVADSSPSAPSLFESALFVHCPDSDASGSRRVVVLERYATRAEAAAGHARWVEAARGGAILDGEDPPLVPVTRATEPPREPDEDRT